MVAYRYMCLTRMSPTSDPSQVFLRAQDAVERLKQLNIFKDGMEVSLTKAKGRRLLLSPASPTFIIAVLHNIAMAKVGVGARDYVFVHYR